jgi:sugar phosphate isomerase/epimerase
MHRPIALQQISAMDLDPPDLVSLAAEVGCAGVSVFTCLPEQMPMGFRSVSRANLAAFRDRLAHTGLTVGGVEHFLLYEGVDLDSYLEGLELGAALGAQRACVTLYDTDAARAADGLAAFAALAAPFGLKVSIEFTGLSPGCDSLSKAVWLADQAGADNVGVCLDPLHLVRTGGTAAEVAVIAPRGFACLQLCDGRGLHRSVDYMAECSDREAPGLGDFPLEAIVRSVPATTPVELETPNARCGGAGPALTAFLRDAVARTRRLLEEAPAAR